MRDDSVSSSNSSIANNGESSANNTSWFRAGLCCFYMVTIVAFYAFLGVVIALMSEWSAVDKG